jgi:hypothetical protein
LVKKYCVGNGISKSTNREKIFKFLLDFFFKIYSKNTKLIQEKLTKNVFILYYIFRKREKNLEGFCCQILQNFIIFVKIFFKVLKKNF